MAKFNIDVVVDPAGAVKGVARVRKELDGTTNHVDRLRRQVTQLGGAWGTMLGQLAATVGIAMGLRHVIDVLAGFETSMGKLKAITRATDAEMVRLRNTAKQLGSTTEFTASQAADGLTYLGMAGFTATESIAAIPAVLDLATAAQMDLGRAADISSNIMSAFGIKADKAADVADVLAAASSRANTDVSQLGDAMKYVGPVAAALGVSINDSAAAIGALSNAGLQGSMAGTGLRRVLSSLVNPTKQAVGVLKGLGVELKDVNPLTNDLTDIVDRLAAAGLSAADALTIFGDRGGPAILALVEQRVGLRQLTEDMKNVEGEADRMAKTMRDTLGGDLKGLQSAVEGVILALGESGLVSILRILIKMVTEVVRAISGAIDFFNKWVVEATGLGAALRAVVDVIEKMGPAIEAVGVAIGTLLAAMVIGRVLAFAGAIVMSNVAMAGGSVIGAAYGIVLTTLSGVFGLVTTAIRIMTVAIMMNPIGFLIGVVAIAVSLLYQFADVIGLGAGRMATLGDLGVATWERLKVALQIWWDLAKTVMGAFFGLFSGPFNAIAELARSIFGDVELSISGLIQVTAMTIDFIVGAFTGAVRAIIAGWELVPAALMDIMIRAMNGVVGIVEAGVNKAISALNMIPGVDIGAAVLGRLENGAAGAAGKLGDVVATAFQSGFEKSPALDAANKILSRAEEIAQHRRSDAALISSIKPPGADLPPTDPVTPGGGAGAGGKKGGGGRGAATDNAATFDELLAKLTQENELLKLNNAERLVRRQILTMEDQLKRQLTGTEAEAVRQAVELNEQLKIQDSILQELRGPAENARATQQAINTLFADGKITLQEYTAALRDLAVASTETANTMGGGLANGLAKVAQQANNLGKGVSDWVVGAFDSATDAIVNFAKTGQINIRQFFQDLFANLLKLATQQLFAKLVGMFLPGAGSLLGGMGGGLPGFATGGDMIVGGSGGTDSQLVAFKATPNERISVRTPGQSAPGDRDGQAPQQPPQVHIKNINVTDPREALTALNTAEGERTILNTIKRNPGAFKRILGAN